jgi:hypothetical protein
MGRASARLLALVAAGLLAAGLAACGGDDSESGGTTTAAPTATTQGHAQQGGAAAGEGQKGSESGGSGPDSGQGAKIRVIPPSTGEGGQPSPAAGDTSDSFTPPQHSDSGGGAGQFRTKGGDNSLQDHGSEASSAELAQAAAALHGYLDARAAGAWRDACSYMVSGIAEGLAQFAGGARGQGCPELLAAISAGMPESVRRIITQADVGSLRVDGDSGFLLFHGADNTDYFMPMANEGGEWKVAAIAASAIP